MRILHIIPALTKGGAERVVTDLANHAAEAGHQVTVLAGFATDQLQWPASLHENVDLRFMALERSSVRTVYPRLPFWIFRNQKWVLEQDVVHCHLTFGSIFGALLKHVRSLAGSKRPVIVETNHAVGMAIAKSRRAFHAWLLSSRDAVALMAEDSYWRDFMAAQPKALRRVIPNAVASPPPAKEADVAEYRRKAGLPDDTLVVGSVGRLLWERRPDLLLGTFARLTKIAPREVHLLLAGEGPMRNELEAEARRRGLDKLVHMPGLITNPANAFAAIDVYLTVNVGATTGVAALEAAHSGLPIAAIQLDLSHEPGNAEWIWTSPDPEALAAHVAALLDDPAGLRRLARKQQAHAAANHSVETMADAYERLYQDALEARGILTGSGK